MKFKRINLKKYKIKDVKLKKNIFKLSIAVFFLFILSSPSLTNIKALSYVT